MKILSNLRINFNLKVKASKTHYPKWLLSELETEEAEFMKERGLTESNRISSIEQLF